ncbi:transcriptional regulator [Vibrio ponticus]|uniref:Transcriptional regulator n=1 Tax=Vibrio ponticus TaxID=265668 RepID=A0ABX3FN69_9VIBR|nr:helix-turn-helix transcriptional regulator [Vibrio ponticus]OLQ95205.1 transcriptional regulator [Vibrio ponticus]
MPIVINIDVMLAKRKMRSNELAAKIGITEQNLSVLKNGRAKAVKLATLDSICKHLQCQPGDILEFVPDSAESE